MNIFRHNREKPAVAKESEDAKPHYPQKQPKPKPYKSDLQVALEVQRKYDKMEADVRIINNALAEVLQGGKMPKVVGFYETSKEYGATDRCLDLIETIMENYDLVKKPTNE